MADQQVEAWNEWYLLEMSRPPTADDVRGFEERAAPLGLTAWEIAILESINFEYGQVDSKERLSEMAFGCFLSKDPRRARDAIEKCFDRRWIHFLTEGFLAEMKQELEAGQYLMAGGLIGESADQSEASLSGRISFTRVGAALYHQWLDFDPAMRGHWAWASYLIVNDRHVGGEVYGTSVEECMMTVSTDDGLRPLGAPEAIGRWCDRWWNRFESGFRIQVGLG